MSFEDLTLSPLEEYHSLCCPECGGPYGFHHSEVHVYNRYEDAEEGVHVHSDGFSTNMDTKMEGNPSSRRGGITISFWCELCAARPVLAISQHKGVEHVGWLPKEQWLEPFEEPFDKGEHWLECIVGPA